MSTPTMPSLAATSEYEHIDINKLRAEKKALFRKLLKHGTSAWNKKYLAKVDEMNKTMNNGGKPDAEVQ